MGETQANTKSERHPRKGFVMNGNPTLSGGVIDIYNAITVLYAEDFSYRTRIESEILLGVWGKVQKHCPMPSRDLLYSVTVRSDGMEPTEQLCRS